MEDTEVTDVTDSNAPGSFAGTELDIGEVGGGDVTGPPPHPPTGAAPLVTGAGVEPVQVPAATDPDGDGLPVYDTIRT